MGLTTLDPTAYGRLLSAELPKAIFDDAELQRVVARLESLDFPERQLSAEEEALRGVLAALVESYSENRYELRSQPAHETLRCLMDLRGMKARDLAKIVGTESLAQNLLAGRTPFDAEVTALLAKYFRVEPDLFN